MSISTKSIQKKASFKDGIRICIMRRIKPEFEFDIWIPTLAPSTELLKSYHNEKINWDKYEIEYGSSVLQKQNRYIQIILESAKKNRITLLCWEKTPERCHRRLLAEHLKNLDKNLKIEIK